MKCKKLFLTLAVFLMAVCSLQAASFEIQIDGIRDPDVRKRRDDDYTGVIIKTNVEEAEVFVDGKLLGKSPIATIDISPSYHNVEIRKSGYDTIKCRIHPKRYYTYSYTFIMQKTCGYIRVNDIPSGATVYVDGLVERSFPMEVYPGSHSVKVRKFGYEDFEEAFYVQNHKTHSVSVKLYTAPFQIKNFELSKNVINPQYSSSIGHTKISFYVTNDGSAMLMVNDRYGNTVWSYSYSSFSTWEQGLNWDGRDSDGRILPDGQYTVRLMSFDYDFSQKIKIDTSLVYPLEAYTVSGSGIGTLPCAFKNELNYVKLFANFGAGFTPFAEGNPLTFLPLTGGLVIDFGHHFELAGAFSGDLLSGKNEAGHVLGGGGSFKGDWSIPLSSELSLNLGGSARYYSWANKTEISPYDTGDGLAFGLMAGLETSDAYLAFSGQYTLGNTIKDVKGNTSSNIFKYGLALSLLPSKNLRVSAWGALHNSSYAEAGLELISMPGTGALSCEAKAWLVKELSKDSGNKNMVINAQFGLSYLF